MENPPDFDLFFIVEQDNPFFLLKVHSASEPSDSAYYQFRIPIQDREEIAKTWGVFYDFKANLNQKLEKIKWMGYFQGDPSFLEHYCDYQITYPFRYGILYFVPTYEGYFLYDPESAYEPIHYYQNRSFHSTLEKMVKLIQERKIPFYSFLSGKRMNREAFYQIMGKREEWDQKWSILLGMEVLYEVVDNGEQCRYAPLWIAPVFYNPSVEERFPTIIGGNLFSINQAVKETPGFIPFSICKRFLPHTFCSLLHQLPAQNEVFKVVVKVNDAFPLTIEQAKAIENLLRKRDYLALPSHYEQ
jgi:hypothetical protein